METQAVDPRAVKWFARKYGITSAQAQALAGNPERVAIEWKLDLWRGSIGWPAANSPLTRGYLLTLMTEEVR